MVINNSKNLWRKKMRSRYLKGQVLIKKNGPLKLGAIAMAMVLTVIGVFWLAQHNKAKAILLTGSFTTPIVPNGDVTTGWTVPVGTSDGTCAGGGTTHHCDRVDEISSISSPSPSTTDAISTGTSGTTGETEQYDMTTGTMPSGGWVSNITLYMYANTAACLGNAPNCDQIGMDIVVGGTAQFAVNKTMTTSYTWYNTSFNAPSGGWTQAQLDGFQAQLQRLRVGGGNAANADDNVSIAAVYAVVTYQYYGTSIVNQTGYTIENDDGTGVDANTVQAGSSFSSGQTITGVKKGERLTLRFQLKNTGSGPMDYANLGLFYDRGDGYWTKVRRATAPITSAGSGCADNKWTCTQVASAGGSHTSIAIDPHGIPWVAYYNTAFYVAHYVGSGGSGCASSAWTCTQLESALVGQYTSIGFSPSGVPWISYYDVSNGDLKVAQYVGSSGSCPSSAAWNCTTIENTGTIGQYTSLAFDSNGNPWIAYQDNSNGFLKTAQYVGSSGTGCATGVIAWTCTTVDNTSATGQFASLAFDGNGVAWISYYYQGASVFDLKVAKYVGSGGTGCGGSTVWSCTAVDTTNDVGRYSSLAIDSSGNPWVSYMDFTNGDLRVAQYLGGATTGTGCAVNTWSCTAVDTTGTQGYYTSMAFSPGGNAWISYYDNTNSQLKLARYVGSSGTGCALTAWTCSAVDSTIGVGQYSSIAFDPTGNPWISHWNSSSGGLYVATAARAGDITASSGFGSSGSIPPNGSSLTASHADMTTAGDSTNKADADCIGGGTWNNGKWFSASEGTVSVPAGNSTAQCTEVAFTIDTSQALDNGTYRFVVATKDSLRPDKTTWRGPASVSSGAYPTLSISSSTTFRAAKDVKPNPSACSLNSSWGCSAFDTASNAGQNNNIVFGTNGNPWISYNDGNTTPAIKVAHYVASGGSGCDAGVTDWSCTTIGSTGTTFSQEVSMAIDAADTPWVAFANSSGNLVIAKYVGSGGVNCSSTAWTCTTIDTTTGAQQMSMAIEGSSNIWISYYDSFSTNLHVAEYVGSGGNCSGSAVWKCTNVDNLTANIGKNTSIALDKYGSPWISYYNAGSAYLNLRVAHYVGYGGGNCTSTEWTCSDVDTTNDVGSNTSIAVDSSNNPWIAYTDNTNSDLRVAQYVGSGGTCSGSTAWNCKTLDSTGTIGVGDNSIAFDTLGNPWISYSDATNVTIKTAKYVGTGGTSCASGVTDWTCTAIASSSSATPFSSISFDRSGTPWVSFYSSGLDYAVMNMPPNPLTATTLYTTPGRNAIRSDGRWHLDSGYTPRNTSTCAATTGYLGYCGIASNDSSYDTLNGTKSRLIINFAAQNNNPSAIPTFSWAGTTNVAPNTAGTTGDIVLQAYNFTTKSWDTVYTNSTASTCVPDCSFSVEAVKAGEQSYYENINNNFWVYFRIWQYENSSSETFETNYANISFENTGSRLFLGKKFLNGAKSSF